jgi:hypothetical protein
MFAPQVAVFFRHYEERGDEDSMGVDSGQV